MSESQEQQQLVTQEYAYQFAFTTGELAPELWFRSDLAKQRTGAARVVNFIPTVRGDLVRRPGTGYVGNCHLGTGPYRLIRFQFSTSQQYMIEAGANYFAFIYQGAYLVNGDGSRYTISTPYAAADLATLRFTQSADVLTIVHPGYPPLQLARAGALNWTLTPFVIGTTLGIVSAINIVPYQGIGFGSTTTPAVLLFIYAVSACSLEAKTEGPLSPPVTAENYDLGYYTQYGVKNTISWGAATGADYYKVYRFYDGVWAFVASTTALAFDDIDYTPDTAVTPPSGTNPFAVRPIASVTVGAPGSTPYSANTYVTVSDSTGSGASLQPLINNGSVIGITVVSGGQNYTAPTVNIVDPGGPLNTTTSGTPATTTGAGAAAVATVSTAINYPGVVGYFQERIVFGGSGLYPQTIWTSRTGNYTDFSVSNPTVDDDAITVTLAARQINAIEHFVPLADLIVMTSGGGWRVDGSKGAVTPSNFDLAPQTFSGVGNPEPIVIGNYILTVEAKLNSVREIVYNLYVNSYVSQDRTLLSHHLLDGHQIVSWAYAEVPNRVIWLVRDDGVLLSLTYLRDLEEEIYAWAQHNTDGVFQCVDVVSEPVFNGIEDVPYFVVTFGTNPPCVVRMHSQLLGPSNTDPRQAWCVDCGLQYNGSPISVMTGLSYLNGLGVVGLADGVPFSGIVEGGDVGLPAAASVVTVGLSYTSSLTTLPVTTGQHPPGARKHISQVRAMVVNTAGLLLTGGNGEPALAFLGPAGSDPGDASDPINSATLVTGVQELQAPEGWDRLGQVTLSTSGPQPANITGVMLEFEAGK